MIIKIISFEEKNTKKFVTFNTPFGIGKAYWYGTFLELNKNYDVEIEIKTPLVWNKNILPLENKDPFHIEYKKGELLIKGVIEDIEDDDCITVRLGNSIILLEVVGCKGLKTETVLIKSDYTVLYDTKT